MLSGTVTRFYAVGLTVPVIRERELEMRGGGGGAGGSVPVAASGQRKSFERDSGSSKKLFKCQPVQPIVLMKTPFRSARVSGHLGKELLSWLD